LTRYWPTISRAPTLDSRARGAPWPRHRSRRGGRRDARGGPGDRIRFGVSVPPRRWSCRPHRPDQLPPRHVALIACAISASSSGGSRRRHHASSRWRSASLSLTGGRRHDVQSGSRPSERHCCWLRIESGKPEPQWEQRTVVQGDERGPVRTGTPASYADSLHTVQVATLSCAAARSLRISQLAPDARRISSSACMSTGWPARSCSHWRGARIAPWAGTARCALCGELIEPGSLWYLAHDDLDRSVYLGPADASVNRGEPGNKTSREW